MIQMPLACPQCGRVLSDEVGWCYHCRAGLSEIEARMAYWTGARRSDLLVGVGLALLPLALGLFGAEYEDGGKTGLISFLVLLIGYFWPHPYATLRRSFAVTAAILLGPGALILMAVGEGIWAALAAVTTAALLLRAFWRRRP